MNNAWTNLQIEDKFAIIFFVITLVMIILFIAAYVIHHSFSSKVTVKSVCFYIIAGVFMSAALFSFIYFFKLDDVISLF